MSADRLQGMSEATKSILKVGRGNVWQAGSRSEKVLLACGQRSGTM